MVSDPTEGRRPKGKVRRGYVDLAHASKEKLRKTGGPLYENPEGRQRKKGNRWMSFNDGKRGTTMPKTMGV